MHEIVTDENGARHGTDGEITVSLLEVDGRMFKRRAIKGVGSASAEEVNWLVAELDGVCVYHNGRTILITRRDLYP